MQAGKLRHLVTIEQPSTTLDSAGASPTAWTEFRKVWAAVKPLRGRELALAKEMFAEGNVMVRTRFIEGVTPAMRINYRGRILNILDASNLEERNRELEILCREVVS